MFQFYCIAVVIKYSKPMSQRASDRKTVVLVPANLQSLRDACKRASLDLVGQLHAARCLVSACFHRLFTQPVLRRRSYAKRLQTLTGSPRKFYFFAHQALWYRSLCLPINAASEILVPPNHRAIRMHKFTRRQPDDVAFLPSGGSNLPERTALTNRED